MSPTRHRLSPCQKLTFDHTLSSELRGRHSPSNAFRTFS
jgi:hypothetical protein